MWEWLSRIASALTVAGGAAMVDWLASPPWFYSYVGIVIVFVATMKGLSFYKELKKSRAPQGHEEPSESPSAGEVSGSVGYVEACDIVERYIHLATDAKRDSIKLYIRHEFIEQFAQTTGAMLGQGEYNGVLLHQWMQSNAARFLVEHRGKMR